MATKWVTSTSRLEKEMGENSLISTCLYLESSPFTSDVLQEEACLLSEPSHLSWLSQAPRTIFLKSRNRMDYWACELSSSVDCHSIRDKDPTSTPPSLNKFTQNDFLFRNCGEYPRKNAKSGKPQHIWCSSSLPRRREGQVPSRK